MKFYTGIKQLASFICIGLLLMQCNSNSSKDSSIVATATDSCTVSVQAADFTASKSDVPIVMDANKNKIVKATKGGWLEYKINVPTAGRYRIQLFAQTSDTLKVNCWMEDYADNTTGRNYNITGNMLLDKDSTTFLMVQKEGSPLNTGMHTMRLHYDSGAVAIDKICFTLMKTHKNSPVVLTQKKLAQNGTWPGATNLTVKDYPIQVSGYMILATGDGAITNCNIIQLAELKTQDRKMVI